MTRAAVLATEHLATLATVPSLTDFSCTLYDAKRLARQVRIYQRDPGMLGHNGIAPAIAACVSSARFHGFRDTLDPYARADELMRVAGGGVVA